MKKEWLVLTGMFSAVMGIIVLCIVFGGYSSLLRSKNRVGQAREFLKVECQKRLNLLPDLVSMAGVSLSSESLRQIQENKKESAAILAQLSDEAAPIETGLADAFEHSQALLTKNMEMLLSAVEKKPDLPEADSYSSLIKRFKDLEGVVLFNVRRHNKEVRYFNTRRTVFPGFLIAKWFGLDKLHFPEIPVELFQTEKVASGSSVFFSARIVCHS